MDGIVDSQTFQGRTHRHQVMQRGNQKMTGAAAGVKELELGQRFGPAWECACCWGRRDFQSRFI